MIISDTLRQENAPSMIYAICKLILGNTFNKSEIMSIMADDQDGEKTFAKNLKFAEDCQFVINNGKHYECLIPVEFMDTYENFISYISLNVFDSDNNFTKLTRWFLSNNISVSKYSAEEISSKCYEVVNVDQNYVRGWHWWMLAFGLATISSYIKMSGSGGGARYIMYDCSVGLKRFFNSNYKDGEVIKVKKFLSDLTHVKKEFKDVVTSDNSSNQICDSLSLSLRILDNLKVIELIYTPDSLDVWHLTESYSHRVKKDITEIKVLRG